MRAALSTRGSVRGIGVTDCVVVFGVVMVELERFDELFDVPLHRDVTVDDLLVDVAQEGPLGQAIEK